jgi:hypothetical protein
MIFKKPNKEEIENQKLLDKHNYFLVKSFMESEFYNKLFLPFLEGRKKDLQNGMIWRGQISKPDEIAIGCIYNSGRISQIEDIFSFLNTIIEKGERIIKEENEKIGG